MCLNREFAKPPLHVAIILDGNGRWARERGKSRSFGHQAGAQNVKRIVRAAGNAGIRYLTLYAFSTENWKRSTLEVKGLMRLFGEYLTHYTTELNENNMSFHIVGDRIGLSSTLQKKIAAAEQATKKNTGMVLNLAINYGGRDEILQGIFGYTKAVLAGDESLSELTETRFSQYLYPSSATDVDLVIRTGGDFRISNFLLWQISYAELYFTPILWPDFTPDDLNQALAEFGHRERRFGAAPGE